MKKILSISFALIVLAASMNNVTVYLSFKLHQAEIAEIFCINKDKPKLHCEGKCYLTGRLAEANEKDNPASPAPHFEETLRINFYPPFSICLDGVELSAERPVGFAYISSNPQPFPHPFFQPPESQLLAL